MAVPVLSRLEKVDLREVWSSEASDFTPWLCEELNLKLLGETIGIELELESREEGVGPFSADVLCKDTLNDAWVLIENQLERTDHTHLGQLLTYAAGLNAVTIAWVAMEITEQHRAALDWLNEITDERFRFFGLEIEVWKIGDSDKAPKFNIVSKPNDWSRTVASNANRPELTPNKQLQLDFWTEFKAFVDESNISLKTQKANPQHWMSFAIGRSGFGLTAIASLWSSELNSEGHELRVELGIRDINHNLHFETLCDMKEKIESDLGHSLKWHNPSNTKSCRIYVVRAAELNNRNKWHEYFKWLGDELQAFDRIFRPLVQDL